MNTPATRAPNVVARATRYIGPLVCFIALMSVFTYCAALLGQAFPGSVYITVVTLALPLVVPVVTWGAYRHNVTAGALVTAISFVVNPVWLGLYLTLGHALVLSGVYRKRHQYIDNVPLAWSTRLRYATIAAVLSTAYALILNVTVVSNQNASAQMSLWMMLAPALVGLVCIPGFVGTSLTWATALASSFIVFLPVLTPTLAIAYAVALYSSLAHAHRTGQSSCAAHALRRLRQRRKVS